MTMSLTRTVSSRREHVTTNARGSNLRMFAGGHLRAKYEVSPSSLLTSWRHLILGPAFHQNLCHFCRYCTPIVDMPESSPHVSPIVPYGSCQRSLRHRCREERSKHPPVITCATSASRWVTCSQSCKRSLEAIDEEFPMLEHLNLDALRIMILSTSGCVVLPLGGPTYSPSRATQ